MVNSNSCDVTSEYSPDASVVLALIQHDALRLDQNLQGGEATYMLH